MQQPLPTPLIAELLPQPLPTPSEECLAVVATGLSTKFVHDDPERIRLQDRAYAHAMRQRAITKLLYAIRRVDWVFLFYPPPHVDKLKEVLETMPSNIASAQQLLESHLTSHNPFKRGTEDFSDACVVWGDVKSANMDLRDAIVLICRTKQTDVTQQFGPDGFETIAAGMYGCKHGLPILLREKLLQSAKKVSLGRLGFRSYSEIKNEKRPGGRRPRRPPRDKDTSETETQPPWTCRNQTTDHMRTDDDWKVNPEMCEDTKSESSFGLWRNDEEEWQSDEDDPTMESTPCDYTPVTTLL